MAKSIRVSDDLYALAEQAGSGLSRSLAQQLEHWARIGAAVDAAGISSAQVLQLLQGGSSGTMDQVMALVLAKGHAHRGSKVLAERHAKDEAAVRAGKVSAKSLHVVPAELIKSAKVSLVGPEPSGTGW